MSSTFKRRSNLVLSQKLNQKSQSVDFLTCKKFLNDKYDDNDDDDDEKTFQFNLYQKFNKQTLHYQ